MNLPGFSAELSLCHGTEHYRSSVTGIPAAGSAEVIPQLRAGGGGFGVFGGVPGFHLPWFSMCDIKCAALAAACNMACAASGPLYLDCLSACALAEIACLADC
jgi:hypothetical protein